MWKTATLPRSYFIGRRGGYVLLQGLPENIQSHGFIHQIKPLGKNASRYEHILFDVLFKDQDKQSFGALSDIIDSCFDQLEEALVEENCFQLYSQRSRFMQKFALLLSAIPVLLLQFYRGGSFFSVIIPTLFLYLCGVLALSLLERKRAVCAPGKELAFWVLSYGLLFASFAASMFLRGDIAHNQFADVTAYLCGLAALPFAVFYAVPAEAGAQKRAEIRAWQDFIATKYPDAVAEADRDAYFYAAMPYAFVLQTDSLLFRRTPQEKLPLPKWYLPIWYETKEGEPAPTHLTTAEAHGYYAGLGMVKRGHTGNTAKDPGSSPLGPIGPVNMRF